MSEMVPEGWKYQRLGMCSQILDSKRIPLNAQERAKRKGVYPYYGANGIQDYIDDFIFDGEYILLAEDGGYFSEYASRPIAQYVKDRFWVNNHAHILKSTAGNSNKWIYYSLVHKNILKYINGGTRSKLNQSDLRDIGILLPTLPVNRSCIRDFFRFWVCCSFCCLVWMLVSMDERMDAIFCCSSSGGFANSIS